MIPLRYRHHRLNGPETLRGASMGCVCGHPQQDHESKILSVPLVNANPLYKVPATAVAHIGTLYPNATYDVTECHCGCTIYDELGE
ncbi:hypothetical protein SEA_BOBBY_175 [Mycobacterium phage Bobby]|nr:hypothetical protein SEA_BOBBY_175 [Mycobacterium phage Bobby]